MANSNNNSAKDFSELKARCKLIFDADPTQYHTDFSLHRYLRARGNVDDAFKAVLKTNKWRREFGIEKLNEEEPIVKEHLEKKKGVLCRHRDMHGRPVIYIPVRNHNVSERDLDELTRFTVYLLEEACKRCHEEIIDNLCIVFDLKDFGLNSMDYPYVKNLIWLLGTHYPERLGICLIINAPTLFSGCWIIIRGWLNEVTASKVTFVNNETELCQYLHPDILPEDS